MGKLGYIHTISDRNENSGCFLMKVTRLISAKITEVCVHFAKKKKKSPAVLDQFLDSISIK